MEVISQVDQGVIYSNVAMLRGSMRNIDTLGLGLGLGLGEHDPSGVEWRRDVCRESRVRSVEAGTADMEIGLRSGRKIQIFRPSTAAQTLKRVF